MTQTLVPAFINRSIRLAGDPLYPTLVRATALGLLQRYAGAEATRAINAALQDEEALIRYTAATALNATDPTELVDLVAPLLFDQSLHNGHPKFFGYITSSAAPLGALADLLVAAVNANVAKWDLSPVASEIEGQTIRWIAELIGYDPGCSGLMVSGGNMANFVGFLAARRARAGWDLRQDDVTITHTPFFHTGGWNVLTLPLLRADAQLASVRTWTRYGIRRVLRIFPLYWIVLLTNWAFTTWAPTLTRATASPD